MPLGSILFTAIYSVVAAKRNKQTSDLFVECMSWKKKNQQNDRRKFVFGATTDHERDEWITAIEYLRTKCIFENFRKNFTNITFPIESLAHHKKKISGNNHNYDVPVSLGTLVKRQNHLYMSNGGVIKSINSSVRRSSFTNFLIGKKRASSISVDSFQGFNQDIVIRELAGKISKLYNASMMQFLGQINENSLKSNPLSSNHISKTPKCLEGVNFVEDISLSSPSVISKNNDQNRRLTNTQSIESPSSMHGQLIKNKNKSIFGKKQGKSNSIDEPTLKKTRSESKTSSTNKISVDLDSNLSVDYYNNMNVRKSEQVLKPNMHVIEENDDENELTQDIDKSKQFVVLEHDFPNINRKDRSATFKPYNYTQNSEPKESQPSFHDKSNKTIEIEESVKQNADKVEEDDQQSNDFDLNDLDDESSEKQIAQIFQKQSNEMVTFSESAIQEREAPLEQKIYVEEDKLEVGNSMSVSQTSKSKFSIPESEKYDPYVETVMSRPTDIKDPIEKVNKNTVKVSK